MSQNVQVEEIENRAFQKEARELHAKIMEEHISLFEPSELRILILMPSACGYSNRNFSWLKNLERLIFCRKRNPTAK